MIQIQIQYKYSITISFSPIDTFGGCEEDAA